MNRIEKLFGTIKYKYAKGNISAQIINKLKRESQQDATDQGAVVQFDAEFDALIMLDRTVDLVSPLCVQKIYEGQVDETFGIKTTQTSIETKILNPKWEKKPGEGDHTDMFLTNKDFLFKEVRGMSLGGLGVVTGRSLREITQVMAEKDNP